MKSHFFFAALTRLLAVANLANLSAQTSFKLVVTHVKTQTVDDNGRFGEYSKWKDCQTMGTVDISNGMHLKILTSTPHDIDMYEETSQKSNTANNSYELEGRALDANGKEVSIGLYVKYDNVIHIAIHYSDRRYLFECYRR